MKSLSKLDPMTVLMLVVIFGVIITMSAQVASQMPASKTTVQVLSIDSTGETLSGNHPGRS